MPSCMLQTWSRAGCYRLTKSLHARNVFASSLDDLRVSRIESCRFGRQLTYDDLGLLDWPNSRCLQLICWQTRSALTRSHQLHPTFGHLSKCLI